MRRRSHPALWICGGSLVMLGLLILLMYWDQLPTLWTAQGSKLVVHCAAGIRVPMEKLARQYEQEFGQAIELRFGPSEAILANIEVTGQGDLFLPADESYIHKARAKGLLAEVLSLARMQAVVITRPGNPHGLSSFADLLKKDLKFAQADPAAAAVGSLTRAHLEKIGKWTALKQQTRVLKDTVNSVANDIHIGSADAGIVWDAVAFQYPQLAVVKLPELDKVTARVQLGVLAKSEQPTDALRFARYVAARDKGLEVFQREGFAEVAKGDRWAEIPEIVVYAGAMLQPAVEETIKEFEDRESVKVARFYNGCGILVSQMQANEKPPDLYFACDASFMLMVQKMFQQATVVSSNQLIIAVHKGNPHGIRTLKDLGKPGLRIGIGHEQQCALGTLTKDTFMRSGFGLYARIHKNVKIQSPSGDNLVNQLKTGALDVAVCYRSNVTPFGDEFDIVEDPSVNCLPEQPVAASKVTEHPQLLQRLLDTLQSPKSRQRFEKLGFRWEQKS